MKFRECDLVNSKENIQAVTEMVHELLTDNVLTKLPKTMVPIRIYCS